jgi:hypothetical protein
MTTASDEGSSYYAVTDLQVREAVEVMRNVPDAAISFDFVDALECVGVPRNFIFTNYSSMKDQMKQMMIAYDQRHGPAFYPITQEAKVNRFLALIQLIKRLPTTSPGGRKKKNKAEIMRLAGCTKDESSAGKVYMACTRASTKAINAANHGPPSRIEIQNDPQASAAAVVSPMSCDASTATEQAAASTASQSCQLFFNPNSSGSETAASDDSVNGGPDLLVIPDRQGRAATFSSLLNNKATRRTTHQVQVVRREEQDEQDLCNLAFRLGTVVLQSVIDGECNLHKLGNANMVAEEVNKMFGIHFLSGRELTAGVKEKLVGLNPKPRGAPRKLPDEDFKDVCALVLTSSAIEQANADPNRLKESELCSLIGQIVNEKKERDGDEPLNDRWLHERVKRRNANVQNVRIVDKREALRVKWVTYRTQLLHHENFEKFVVEKEFARLPESKEEEGREGYVVYHEGQESRFVNFDECQLTLDGTDERAGGRPGSTASHVNVPECGASSNKSAGKCTLMMGIAGDEALPPFFIFPSKAKTNDPKLQWSILDPLPQVHAQYGYKQKRYFDVPFACNEKGGMDSKTFKAWSERCLRTYFPDAADTKGKRVIAKSDSGPGRQCVEYLMEARIEGWYQYPGVPNGTENGQEMDQLFAAFKRIAYENRELLYKARWRIESEKAVLSKADCIIIVFGGTIELSDGSHLNLRNAFALAFTAEKIRHARVKCGYCPATRNALMSDRIRHEVYESDDGIDEERDPLGVLYDELEKQNHAVVNSLVTKGYISATNLRRCIDRITARQVEGRESVATEPHTRERQELLMRATTAGQFFRATLGGGALNCSDALLGHARKDMLDKANVMEKEKKEALKFDADAEIGWKIYDTKPSYLTWNMVELKLVIRWLQGLKPPEGEKLANMNKAGLQNLYRQKYSNVQGSRSRCWTFTGDRELDRLRAGEIGSFEETAIYGKAVEALNDYLVTKINAISRTRRADVLAKVFEEWSESEKEDIATILLEGDSRATADNNSATADNNNSSAVDGEGSQALDNYSSDDENNSLAHIDPMDPRLRGVDNDEDSDSISDSLAARLPVNVADSESESESASNEGSHNAGGATTTEARVSRNKSEESDTESSEASYMSPPDNEEEDGNNATDWYDEDDNKRIEESQGVPWGVDNDEDCDSISDLLAARLTVNVADSESELESASNEGSHNAGGATTTEARVSRNKSEESDLESSEASYKSPPDIEEEDGNNATDWCDEDDNKRIEESQGVPSNCHKERHDIESTETMRLQVLLRIECLEKKKNMGQADGDNRFREKLAEADRRLQLRNGTTLRIVDWESLFHARGEDCPSGLRKDKMKRIKNQWEAVKLLPVTWEPWTEADDEELKESRGILAEMDD